MSEHINNKNEETVKNMNNVKDTAEQAGVILGAVASVLGAVISIISKKK